MLLHILTSSTLAWSPPASACKWTALGFTAHIVNSMRLQRCKAWAEALTKIARMILTIKLDWNWSSFQLANSAPPLGVTDSAIAPSARMGNLANVARLIQNVIIIN